MLTEVTLFIDSVCLTGMTELLNWRTYIIDVTDEIVDATDGSNVHWHICVGHETCGEGERISLDNSATIHTTS